MIFLAQRGVDVLALGQDARVRAIVCCEGGADVRAVGVRLGCPVDSLEDRLGRRRAWTNVDVEEAGRALIGAHSAQGEVVTAYASFQGIAALARKVGAAFRGVDPALKAALDDKVTARRLLRAAGVGVPAHFATFAGEVSFASACRRVGTPFVIQTRVGSSGLGTWIVRAPEDLDAAKLRLPSCEPVLVSGHGGDLTLNAHGLVGDGTVIPSPPSVQAHGIAPLADGEARYCGNDFSAAARLDPWLLASTRDGVIAAGRALERLGYRGVFGIDFVVGDGTAPLALEINPRLQGSTWILTELGRAAGRRVLDAAGAQRDRLAVRELAHRSMPIEGSCLVLHLLAGDRPRADHGLRAGAYRVGHAGRLVWRRAALSPADCDGADVVVGGMALAGTELEPGAVLGRIASRRQLLADDGRSLSRLGHRAVAAARARLVESAPDRRRSRPALGQAARAVER